MRVRFVVATVGALALVSAVGCGSSGSGGSGGSLGSGGAAGSAGHGGGGGSGGSAGSGYCISTGVTGTAPSCDYYTLASLPDRATKCEPGSKPGTCPTKGVVGCCLNEPPSTPFKTVSCYYDAASARNEKGLCGGKGMTWSTSMPSLLP